MENGGVFMGARWLGRDEMPSGCRLPLLGILRTGREGQLPPRTSLAIRDLAPGHREELCVVLQSYARRPGLLSRSIQKGLETLRLESVDILLLGWHEDTPSDRLMEAPEREREQGTFRHLAISSHQRPLFRELLSRDGLDVFQVRYNAAHTGAEVDLFPHLDPEDSPGIVAFTCTRWGELLDPKKMPPGEAPLSAGDCYRFALTSPHVHVAITGPKNDGEMRHALDAPAPDAVGGRAG